jgi:hypothetical protein
MPTGLIDSALPSGSELPTSPSAVPALPASEDAGKRSRAIIPGDDPGDQQPPKSTPLPFEAHITQDQAVPLPIPKGRVSFLRLYADDRAKAGLSPVR